MNAKNLLEIFKSAPVVVQNDNFGAVHRQYWVILVLLGMSTALDTINHEKLLSLLEHHYGVAGSVLACTRSYLSDRSQCVYLQGQGGAPSKIGVACGVPQCSLLGPLLFSAYTTHIGDIVRRHNFGDSSYTLTIPSYTSNLRWLKSTESCHYAEFSNA